VELIGTRVAEPAGVRRKRRLSGSCDRFSPGAGALFAGQQARSSAPRGCAPREIVIPRYKLEGDTGETYGAAKYYPVTHI